MNLNLICSGPSVNNLTSEIVNKDRSNNVWFNINYPISLQIEDFIPDLYVISDDKMVDFYIAYFKMFPQYKQKSLVMPQNKDRDANGNILYHDNVLCFRRNGKQANPHLDASYIYVDDIGSNFTLLYLIHWLDDHIFHYIHCDTVRLFGYDGYGIKWHHHESNDDRDLPENRWTKLGVMTHEVDEALSTVFEDRGIKIQIMNPVSTSRHEKLSLEEI